jgi:NAD+ kinase
VNSLKVIIFYNPTKTDVRYIHDNIKHEFEKYSIEITDAVQACKDCFVEHARDNDYFIVLGGDGTVLRTVPLAVAFNKPIIGINMGKLGFLTAFSQNEIGKAAECISMKKLSFSERMLLEADFNGTKHFCLNDLNVQRSTPDGTIDISVSYMDEPVYSFSGDGILVSTPTGSTGYGLSAGGAILDPSIRAMELIPLAAHGLNMRPLIFGPEKNLSIRMNNALNEKGFVLVDGNIVSSLKKGESVHVRVSSKTLFLAQKEKYSFLELLNQKLAFGRRFE